VEEKKGGVNEDVRREEFLVTRNQPDVVPVIILVGIYEVHSKLFGNYLILIDY
jgi:hypothetical protein